MQEWKEKHGTIHYYNQQAKIYDVQYFEEQKDKIEEIIDEINFRSKDLILDLGCGTGLLFPHMEKRVSFLVGIDFSKNALIEAKKRINKLANWGRTKLSN